MSIENLISLREKDSRNVIGLMSGTSCDGIEEGQWEDRVRSCFLRNDMEIEELSISLPYYYSVLSFLYANSEEEQDSEELNEYLRLNIDSRVSDRPICLMLEQKQSSKI